MIDHFGPHPMTLAILGRVWKLAASLYVIRGMQSTAFLTSTLANYLALIFRRLSGEGRTEVGENGQNSEDVGLQTPSKLQALSFYYVLVGVSVSSDWKRHKITEHDAKNIR